MVEIFIVSNIFPTSIQMGVLSRKCLALRLNLLTMVLKQMNMTFVQVPTPEGFKIEEGLRDNLIRAMIAKEAFIALG